ncbi:AraC family ligand binding domain-containing protein [Paenibacillus sp. CC-CFT747]|nr:AraC family ligand binding domain-containing protein [Paenibacillus sp. CC-CFT747]
MSSLTSMAIAAKTASGLNEAANSLYRPELLAEEYRPRVSAYYFRQWEGFRMDAHSHDRVEIMYVLKGACVVDTEGASLSLKKGDFVLLDANVSHNLLVGDPCRMLNVEFEFASGGGVGLCLRELAAGGEELGRFLAKPRPFWLLKDDGEVYPTLKASCWSCPNAGEAAIRWCSSFSRGSFFK